MILKSLKLENIRSYANQEIHFPVGSTLLAGDIGAGKTSLLLAIEFALFGLMRNSLDGNNLLRYGKNEASVTLQMDIDGKDVTIKRKLKRGKKDIQQDAGYIIIDGKKKEKTAVELKAEVLGLLGYPAELLTKNKNLVYRYTVYTPQEQMKQILEEEDRTETLRKVFGIDKYKRIRENSLIILREMKEKRKMLELRLEGFQEKRENLFKKTEDIKETEKETAKADSIISSIKAELREQKAKEERTQAAIKKLNDLKRELEVNNEKLSSRVERNSQLKQEIEKNLDAIKEAKARIESISVKEDYPISDNEVEKEIAAMESMIKKSIEGESRLKEQLNSALEKEKALKEEIAAKHSKTLKIGELEETLKELKEKIGDKSNSLKEAEHKELLLGKITGEMHVLDTKVKESQHIKAEINKLKHCPTCLQPVSSEHKSKVNDVEQQKIEEQSGMLHSIVKQRSLLLKEIEELKEKIESLVSKEKKAIEIETLLKGLEAMNKEAEEKKYLLEKIKEKTVVLHAELDDIRRIDAKKISREISEKKLLLREIAESKMKKKEREHFAAMLKEKEHLQDLLIKQQADIKKAIGEINANKLQLNSELAELKSVEKEYDSLKKEMSENLEKEKDLLVKRAYLAKESETAKNAVHELEKELGIMEKNKEKLHNIQEMSGWIETHFINLMEVMERHVMATVYNEFNRLFQEWFNLLIEDESIQARLDEEFAPIINQNNYDAPLSNLSGGEKTAAALAYRLALNKVVNDLMSRIKTKDLLILDEPTDGFSSEQLDKIRTVLEAIGVKQTIIVSHESKIESFVDNVMRIRKNNGFSEVMSE